MSGIAAGLSQFLLGQPSTDQAGRCQGVSELYATKIRYIHLRTPSKEHKALAVLAENELDVDTIFSILAKNHAPYVAIELDPAGKLEDCYGNILKKGVEYLVNNF